MPPKRSKKSPPLSAFISYAQADDKKAHAIASGLEARSFKCWIAPRDVRPGRSYGDEIMRGIEQARALILVLSKAANDSPFVTREVERAVSKKKPIFPIRVEKVLPSAALEFFVSSTHWIDAWSGRFAAHVDRLADMLAENEGEVKRGASKAAAADEGQAPGRGWRSPWVLASGSAGLLVAAALAVMFLYPKEEPSPQVTPNPTLDADYQNCQRLLGEAAIAACDQAIASGRWAGVQLALLYATRGFHRQSRNDLAGALTDYNAAMGLNPNMAVLFNNRGNVYRDSGEYDRALADYDRALELDPGGSSADTLASRGYVYQQKGDLDRAKESYERALALNPRADLKTKIEGALNALTAEADPSVITKPKWNDARASEQVATVEEPSGGPDTEMIVGGAEAQPGQYPWLVRLYASSDDSIGFCGGSIVGAQWVLTTAHCAAAADPVIVGYGSADRTKMTKLESEKVVVHQESDLALIRLKRPIPNAPAITLANDKVDSTLLAPGEKLALPGWGSQWEPEDGTKVAQVFERFTGPPAEDGGAGSGLADAYEELVMVPVSLTDFKVTVVDPKECMQVYEAANLPPPTDNESCAAQPSLARDACPADGGGPVLARADTPSGYIQVGIVSLGRLHCGDPTVPGVYAKVSPYAGWIAETMAQD